MGHQPAATLVACPKVACPKRSGHSICQACIVTFTLAAVCLYLMHGSCTAACGHVQHAPAGGQQHMPDSSSEQLLSTVTDGRMQQQNNVQPRSTLQGQEPMQCSGGFLSAPRSVFCSYHDDQSPGLTEAIHAEDRVYVVFSTKIPQRHLGHWAEAARGNWSVEFESASNSPGGLRLRAHSLGRDAHRHTFIIHAALPQALRSHPRRQPPFIHVEGRLGNLTRRYERVPLCLYPDMQAGDFKHIIACTQITAGVAHLVPEWAVYHRLQGFQDILVYVDDDMAAVQEQLAALVAAGIMQLVHWQWPARYRNKLQFQQAVQNGCLMRARGRARWVGLHDVDEYFQVLPSAGQTVAGFLQERADLEHFGTLVANSMWWGSPANSSTQASPAANGSLVMQRYQARSACCEGTMRQKMLANPRGMSYNSVHHITTGGQEHAFNGETEMRLNHFKLPHTRAYEIHDPSFASMAAGVRRELAKLGYVV